MMKIYIVDARTGRFVSAWRVWGRGIASIISELPLLLGYLWAAWDPRRQTWHDKIANTVVVRDVRVRAAISSDRQHWAGTQREETTTPKRDNAFAAAVQDGLETTGHAVGSFGSEVSVEQTAVPALPSPSATPRQIQPVPPQTSPTGLVGSVPGVARTSVRGPELIGQRVETGANTTAPTVPQIRFSNGHTVLLDQAMIVGRDPESNELPFADKVAIDDRSVSKTHLAVSIDGAGVVRVKDLASMNGVELETGDGQRQMITVDVWRTVGDDVVVYFGQSSFSIVRT